MRRRKGITNSAQRETHYAHDEFGNQTRTTFADGSYALLRYDEFGRQVAEMQPTAGSVTAVWSESDNSFVIDGSSPVERIPTKLYEYDDDGRLIVVELPSVANPNNGNTYERPRYEYGYDSQGNQTLIRDPLGHETRFSFNAAGQQLTRTLPLGFGPDGVFGTPDDSDLPEGNFSERFEYDDRGRQTLHVSFEGVVTRSIYDPQTDRLSTKEFFQDETQYDDGSGLPSEIWTYKYDAFGRQLEVVQDRDGNLATDADQRVTTNSYDDQGRLVQVSNAEGVIVYDYDDLGRKTATKIYPADTDPATETPERVTSYGYDELGRLKTVIEDLDPASTEDDPLATTYGYDLLGNLDRTDLPNGVIEDYVYDELNRLDTLTHYAPDGTVSPGSPDPDLSNNAKLAEFNYTVRADGKRRSVTETFWLDDDNDPLTPAVPHANQVDWTYDELGRLVDEAFDHFDDTIDQTEHFVYDLAGNRRHFTTDRGNDGSIDEAVSYLFDVNDRLTTESKDVGGDGSVDQTTTYGYDHTQQASKNVSDALGSPLSALSYSYDLQGRMTQVVTETFTGNSITRRERVTYSYDTIGIRASSLYEIDGDADGTYESSTRTEFVVDHHNLTGYQQTIKETTYDEEGKIVKTVEYTIGHDEIAQTVNDYDGNGNVVGQPQTHVFGHDGHGSVRVLYDMAAAVAQVFAFDAYGQLTAIHNGAAQFISVSALDAVTSVLFSGEHFDAKIDQQYLRARFYEPATGRFNRLDDFFGILNDPQSFHKYVYVHDDPVNRIDPTGQFGVVGTMSASAIGSTLNQINGYAGDIAFDSIEARSFRFAVATILTAAPLLGAAFSSIGRGIGPIMSDLIDTVPRRFPDAGFARYGDTLVGKLVADEARVLQIMADGLHPAFKSRTVIVAGDDAVAATLKISKYGKKIDFLSLDKLGRLVLSDSKGAGDILYGFDQLNEVYEVAQQVVGREISRAELIVPRTGQIGQGLQVIDGLLYNSERELMKVQGVLPVHILRV